jgi:phosphopantothenoylcysteine synthetase/decarboxylase
VGLDSAGFEPKVRNLASFQDDYGWKTGEGEIDGVVDDDDDDEGEDEDEGDEDDDQDSKDEEA